MENQELTINKILFGTDAPLPLWQKLKNFMNRFIIVSLPILTIYILGCFLFLLSES